ncbi:MAG: hypothetical protein KR126chlam1_01282 [Chlamydiae bacterium]|nr:hypothetical protein [Chlamydiota bacterium]
MATSLQLTPNITAFFQALGEEDFERAEKLLEKIDLPNYSDSGSPPLHWAACGGKIEILNFLLDHGLDVDTRDSDGLTALQVAAMVNQIVVAHILIKRGANVNAEATRSRNTALHVAVWFENEDFTQLLSQRGANMTKNAKGKTPRDFAIDHKNARIIDILDTLEILIEMRELIPRAS